MAARVSGSPLFFAGEEKPRVGMEEKECGASPGLGGVEKEAGERLGGGHGVSSGMPGTQLCAWLPGEDDSAREVGWAGWAFALGDR